MVPSFMGTIYASGSDEKIFKINNLFRIVPLMIHFRKSLEGIQRPQMEADAVIVGGGRGETR
jgi:hypothetical protein